MNDTMNELEVPQKWTSDPRDTLALTKSDEEIETWRKYEVKICRWIEQRRMESQDIPAPGSERRQIIWQSWSSKRKLRDCNESKMVKEPAQRKSAHNKKALGSESLIKQFILSIKECLSDPRSSFGLIKPTNYHRRYEYVLKRLLLILVELHRIAWHQLTVHHFISSNDVGMKLRNSGLPYGTK